MTVLVRDANEKEQQYLAPPHVVIKARLLQPIILGLGLLLLQPQITLVGLGVGKVIDGQRHAALLDGDFLVDFAPLPLVFLGLRACLLLGRHAKEILLSLLLTFESRHLLEGLLVPASAEEMVPER